jgi:hypothetical protein
VQVLQNSQHSSDTSESSFEELFGSLKKNNALAQVLPKHDSNITPLSRRKAKLRGKYMHVTLLHPAIHLGKFCRAEVEGRQRSAPRHDVTVDFFYLLGSFLLYLRSIGIYSSFALPDCKATLFLSLSHEAYLSPRKISALTRSFQFQAAELRFLANEAVQFYRSVI